MGGDKASRSYHGTATSRLNIALDVLADRFESGDHDAAIDAFDLVFSDPDSLPAHREFAVRQLEFAAASGHVRAQSILGYQLARGNVLERDLETAEFWLLLAAQGGEVLAQLNLGIFYVERADSSPDAKEIERLHKNAVKWLRLASDAGELNAMSLLGMVLVEYDDSRAEGTDLLRSAAERGDTHAEALLTEIESEIKEQEQ